MGGQEWGGWLCGSVGSGSHGAGEAAGDGGAYLGDVLRGEGEVWDEDVSGGWREQTLRGVLGLAGDVAERCREPDRKARAAWASSASRLLLVRRRFSASPR